MDSPALSQPSSGYGDGVGPLLVVDYLALGCLCFFPNGCSSLELDLETTCLWSELRDVSVVVTLLPPELDFVIRLFRAQWVRIFKSNSNSFTCLRIYLLPDDVHQSTLDRHTKALRVDLGQLCSRLDVSIEAWKGRPNPHKVSRFDLWATGVDRSLFWLFNSLPSPSPNIEQFVDRYSRAAAERVVSKYDPSFTTIYSTADPQDATPESVPNLKAVLYPYQARTVATMIRKEAVPSINLDTRYEARTGPAGDQYFYSARELQFKLSPPQYEGSKGGVLAETMGVGKTVIIIALILATRFHLPHIPPQYSTSSRPRPTVGRLADMAVSAAGRSAVPLKSHLHFFYHNSDIDLRSLESRIDSSPIHYEIPYVMRRSMRKSSITPPPRRLRLCSTTIIVVPRNLLRQWQAELRKHANLSNGGLKILVLERAKDVLPSPNEIANHDILLFSKTRFEQEAKDGQDDKGRSNTNVRAGCQCPYIGSTRIRDCTCLRPEEIYHSPLKELHFLRIVIDEGHEFSSSSSNAVKVATTLVNAERRWIVSGTPVKERLFGVDVELAGSVANKDFQGLEADDDLSSRFSTALLNRQSFNRQEELNGASKSLGVLLSNFLQVRPWAGTEGELKVEWEDFAFRHEIFRGKTHSAFSQCMVSTLSALVLKTRPEDVERDILLPPLHVSVKLLKPSHYDIITLNLFNFFITANVVTSERTDVDYLFHKNSTASRHSLVRNLRASPFFWTGWSERDVVGAIGHSERYMAKEGTSCTPEDRKQLSDCVKFARTILDSEGWKAMSRTHELALYVQDWPDKHRTAWSLDGCETSMMVGATQLHAAQKFVNGRLFDQNPTENLAALGQTELQRAFTIEEKEQKVTAKEGTTTKMGVPASAVREKQFDSRQHASTVKGSSKKPQSVTGTANIDSTEVQQFSPVKRKKLSTLDNRELPADSPLITTSVIGTVSSKLSYLLGRVMELHSEEKILIFYDADNAAWYISQVLDLFHIKHLIYARHLNVEQRSKYIVAFDTDDSIRVLLMDISHGACGLNINKASRVFFLNPPCVPHTEAQAIKRAHRIGQTKPVYVETLVLEGTIEEAILNRSKAMTREEHDNAGKEISNDSGIANIIQSAKSIPLPAMNDFGIAHMAPLDMPLQVFGREGRHDVKIKDIDAEEGATKDRPKKKQKKVAFAAGGSSKDNSTPLLDLNVQPQVMNMGSIFG